MLDVAAGKVHPAAIFYIIYPIVQIMSSYQFLISFTYNSHEFVNIYRQYYLKVFDEK